MKKLKQHLKSRTFLTGSVASACIGFAGIIITSHALSEYTRAQDPIIPLSQKDSLNETYSFNRYKKNFDTLLNSLNQVNLPSDVDKDLFIRAFLDWGYSEDGHEVISGLPQNITFNNAISERNDCFAYYTPRNNQITFSEILFQNTKNWYPNNQQATYAEAISHELRHAYQKQIGLIGAEELSPEQFAIQHKLFEAEARAMHQVEGIIQRFKLHNPENLKKFSAIHFEYNTKNPSNNIALELQNCLLDGKSLYQAQKIIAGKIMHDTLVGKNDKHRDTEWLNHYHKATERDLKASTHFRISKEGNPDVFNGILDYYHKEYGLTRDSIDYEALLPPNFEQIKKDLKYSLTKSELLQACGILAPTSLALLGTSFYLLASHASNRKKRRSDTVQNTPTGKRLKSRLAQTLSSLSQSPQEDQRAICYINFNKKEIDNKPVLSPLQSTGR